MDGNEFAEGILLEMFKFKDNGMGPGRAHGEFRVLGFLADSNESSIPSEISTALLLSNARIAMALNALEKKHLVTREIDSLDRRKIIVRITEDGKDLVESSKNTFKEDLKQIYDHLGESDAKEFLRLMKKVNEIVAAHKAKDVDKFQEEEPCGHFVHIIKKDEE